MTRFPAGIFPAARFNTGRPFPFRRFRTERRPRDPFPSDKGEVIAWALRHYPSLLPSRALMVGDRWYDVAGAKQNGLASVGVLYGYGSREEMEKAGADYIAGSVAELGFLLTRL